MSHDVALCVTIHCDRCLAPASSPDGPPRHWLDLATALRDLGATLGWEASARQQICPSCVQTVTCQNVGHDWGPWRSMLPLGEKDLALRLCERCGQDEVASLDCFEPPLAGPAS